ANCVDSTAAPEAVFASEIEKLKKDKLRPKEQLTLEPYHRDHAVVIGQYRPMKHRKAELLRSTEKELAKVETKRAKEEAERLKVGDDVMEVY
ncbi:fibrillarin, putative, partial [Perkinsus marinus ATCC 50983]